jgi:hypothetical protein
MHIKQIESISRHTGNISGPTWQISNGKVLAHLGIKSKVLPGPLTDLSAWVGFWTSIPEQGVKYHLWVKEK